MDSTNADLTPLSATPQGDNQAHDAESIITKVDESEAEKPAIEFRHVSLF
jgi:hypothetical protein